jgi:hypothetical protein
MANANPSLRATPVNLAERSALPVADPSPIKKNHGREVKKVRCEVCDMKYGFDVDEGDKGCPDCEARMARRAIQSEKLARLEKQAEELEKENAEYEAKEKELQDRILKAQKKAKK